MRGILTTLTPQLITFVDFSCPHLENAGVIYSVATYRCPSCTAVCPSVRLDFFLNFLITRDTLMKIYTPMYLH